MGTNKVNVRMPSEFHGSETRCMACVHNLQGFCKIAINPKTGEPGAWRHMLTECAIDTENFKAIRAAENALNQTKRKPMHAPQPIRCHQNGITYKSIVQAAELLQVPHSSITYQLSGKCKSARGYTFERV